MAFTLVQNISGSECIGSSRQKIVNNFTSLESEIVALSANTIYPSSTNTIDFTYVNSTRNLQAIVKTNSIQDTHLQSNSVTTNKIVDGSVNRSKLEGSILPALAKAWVNFDGTGATGANQTIRANYNVSSVVKNGVGDYTINFSTPLSSANYAICGTSSHTTSNATNTGFGTSVSIHPTVTPTTNSVRIWNVSLTKAVFVTDIVTAADSSLISVQIFH
jgi:hypothetical protein